MYTEDIREEVSQGDIFKGVPIAYVSFTRDSSGLSTRVEYVIAVMISYDCDYDKKNCAYALFAEVRPLEEIAIGSRGNIRKYMTRNTFYLPAIPGIMEESYIDFRRTDRVSKPVIEYKAVTGDRLCSLTDTARFALQEQIATFFGCERDSDSDETSA